MRQPFEKADIKVAVIGGGTGSFMLLTALKDRTSQIAALVNMVDDGGSTGVLRDELGVLPPGDVRQCLVALSRTPKLRELFSYRFDEGTFGGHSFGNILLTALEKATGSFSEAVETASEILRIRGTVIPVTLDDVRLTMDWPGTSLMLCGERVIDAEYFKNDPRRATLALSPEPEVNQLAIEAIMQADMVVVAPGDLYTSLGPILITPKIGNALRATKALKVYVSNLVTKQGQTESFTVSDHADELERLAGGHFLDYVLYNAERPTDEQRKRYEKEHAYAVVVDHDRLKKAHYTPVPGSFIGHIEDHNKSDNLPVTRNLIRHDSEAVARALFELYIHSTQEAGHK